MTDYRRIMSLLLEGRSYREIGAITACSQTTIRTARRVLDAEDLTTDRVRRLTDAEVAGLFPDGRSRVKDEYDDPGFAKIVASFEKNQHFTLLQGWRSYTSRRSQLRKYVYSQYCALFNAYVRKHDLTAVLKHEPGKTMFIDWAGDTIDLVDAITGTITKAYLFVTVLPNQAMLNEYSNTDLLIVDDFLTVGIDPEAAADLFTILANREHRAATVIASQSGPDYWLDVLPDKVAADSIVNRLVNHAKKITLGDIGLIRIQGVVGL